MNFNLIQLLEQLKKFMQQENGSWFSLFLYLIVGLTIGDWIISRLIAYNFPAIQTYIVGGCIVGLSIITRFFTRVVQVKKDKINIGIADLLVIYLNEATAMPVTYEMKTQLASEAAQYLYSQVQSEMYDGAVNKSLNLIKLPSRIQVNFENERNIADDLQLDILVRGTLKYIEGKYYLNYKLTFAKKIESWAFSEIVQSINAFPDIEFDLHGKTTEIQLFTHQLIRVSQILALLSDIQQHKFLSSHSAGADLIKRIQSFDMAESNSINKLILYLANFVSMKNLLSMQDRLDKNKIKDILQGIWIQDGIEKCFKGLSDSLKKYFALMKHDLVHDEQFELEFLYAMSNNPKQERGDDASFLDTQSDLHSWTKDLLSGYFSLIHDNSIDAKLHYSAVIMQDPDNMIALRSMGIVEYNMQNYLLAKQYLVDYLNNSDKHVFFTHYKDTKVLNLLAKTHRHLSRPIGSIIYRCRYRFAVYKNRAVRKKYIIV